ncbi:MAG: hypothetical protein PHD33_05025, partial [Atribacterota bacterium]|nr:hypothetical protein [Atribacterota bacterium]
MLKIFFILIIILLNSCEKNSDNLNSDQSNDKLPPITGTPLLWGFDDAGSGLRQVPYSSITQKAIEEFGFDIVVHHYHPTPKFDNNISNIQKLHDFYSKLDVDWIINVESANFIESFIDEKGKDWYNHPDGRHFFLFPDEILLAMSELKNKPGIMYDEAAHMQ